MSKTISCKVSWHTLLRQLSLCMLGVTALSAASGSATEVRNSSDVKAIPAAQTARQTFNIPAGPLGPALRRLADETGLRILYDATVTENANTIGVKGRYMPMLALEILLACTGVNYHFLSANNVMLTRVVAVPPLVMRKDGTSTQ
jgi:hypothetical protein